MQKGKFGIYLWFYALLAFILAFLGQILSCVLLLGFAILAERDSWLNRQVLQALFLALISSVVSNVFGVLNVFSAIPILGTAISVLISVVNFLLTIAILFFCILGAVRTTGGKEANLPLLGKLAARASGFIESVPPQAPPAAPSAPAAPAAWTQPKAPTAQPTDAPSDEPPVQG